MWLLEAQLLPKTRAVPTKNCEQLISISYEPFHKIFDRSTVKEGLSANMYY